MGNKGIEISDYRLGEDKIGHGVLFIRIPIGLDHTGSGDADIRDFIKESLIQIQEDDSISIFGVRERKGLGEMSPNPRAMIEFQYTPVPKEKTVAYDIDDVLAAFYPGACQIYGRPELKVNIWDGKVACKWIADNMKHMEMMDGFWGTLDQVSHPNSMIVPPAAYITSSAARLLEIRKTWLAVEGFPEAPTYHSKNKLETMRELGIDILVDDSPRTVKMINEDPGPEICLQFVPPYMSEVVDEKYAIRHLSEVKRFI